MKSVKEIIYNRLINLTELTMYRYIRVSSNGSDASAGNHFVETQVFSNGINIALNKPRELSFIVTEGIEEFINDDDSTADNYVSSGQAQEDSYIIDFEDLYIIDQVKHWNFWTNGRKYNMKIQLSSNKTNWITIYDYEVDSIHVEDETGLIIDIEPQQKYNLDNLLAKSILDDEIALYENFAPQKAIMPYVIYSTIENNSNHFARNEGGLSFEIYTQDSTVLAESIKDEFIKILDKQRILYEDGNNIYFDYVRDGLAFADSDDAIHHHVEFHYFYWRTDFIDHLNTI